MSDSTHDDSKPPVFNSWQGWYTLVIGVLLIQIVLYYSLTRLFS